MNTKWKVALAVAGIVLLAGAAADLNRHFPGGITLSGNSHLYTDSGTELQRDGVPVGGGGGQTIWTNYTAIPDPEGGTVYTTALLNPISDNFVSYSMNNLTNFWGYPGMVMSIGYPPIDTALVATSENTMIFSIGDNGLKDASLTNNGDFFFYGDGLGQNATFDSCGKFALLGSNGGRGTYSHVSGLYSIGDSATSGTFVQCGQLYDFGGSSGTTRHADTCNDLYNFGTLAGNGTAITNSQNIFNYGYRTGEGGVINNCSDLYFFGYVAGMNLTLTGITHAFIAGSGGSVTNSNDWVAGNTTYNYVFPGTSFSTLANNGVAPSTISVTSSPFTWTNTSMGNRQVFIYGGTVSDVKVNGATVADSTGVQVVLQPNESVVVTYSVGPSMKWKLF